MRRPCSVFIAGNLYASISSAPNCASSSSVRRSRYRRLRRRASCWLILFCEHATRFRVTASHRCSGPTCWIPFQRLRTAAARGTRRGADVTDTRASRSACVGSGDGEPERVARARRSGRAGARTRTDRRAPRVKTARDGRGRRRHGGLASRSRFDRHPAHQTSGICRPDFRDKSSSPDNRDRTRSAIA